MNASLGTLEEFVEKNIKLVPFTIKKYCKGYLSKAEFEDLYQYGCIGLIDAYRMYNGSSAISTFAVNSIRWSIMNSVTRENHQIKLSRRLLEVLNRMVRENLLHVDARIASDHLGVSAEEVELVRDYRLVSKAWSVEKEVDEGITILDTLGTSDDSTIHYVKEFIQSLPDDLQTIIRMRMDGAYQREIGRVVGVSQAEINRRLVKIGKMYAAYQEGREMGA